MAPGFCTPACASTVPTPAEPEPYSAGLFVKGYTTVFITTGIPTTVLYLATKSYCAQQTLQLKRVSLEDLVCEGLHVSLDQ